MKKGSVRKKKAGGKVSKAQDAAVAVAADGGGDEVPFGGGDGSTRLGQRAVSFGSKPGEAKRGSVKLTIRFDSKVDLPSDFEETMWSKLKHAMQAVHTQTKTPYPQEELYKACQDLCINNYKDSLHAKVTAVSKAHIGEAVLALSSSNACGATLLQQLGQLWDTTCTELVTIKTLFGALDRMCLLQSGQLPLWEMGLGLFKAAFIEAEGLLRRSTAAFLEQVKHERAGGTADRTLLKKIVAMYSSLNLYPTIEAPLIEQTSAFYQEEAVLYLSRDNAIHDFIHTIDRRLLEENDRVDAYLSPSTRRQLIAEAEARLITENQSTLAGGFAWLMDRKMTTELGMLYRQLDRPNVQKTDTLKQSMKSYVEGLGTKKVTNAAGDATLIAELLAFKKEMDDVVGNAFGHRKEFVYTLRDGFEAFINLRENRPAELLAKYVDGKMKLGVKESDDELEPTLEACLDLFRLVQAKDVFEAFYNKDFAKRLLLSKCANPDAEKAFIGKLKAECGPAFTTKLEGMLKDMDLSKEIVSEYRQPKSDVQLQVQVLTESHWPTYQSSEVLLPKSMSAALDHFKEYYLKKHSGRRLVWQSCLCTCTLKATCAKWKKELIVSLIQALVLLVFNTEQEATFKEIKKRVGCDDADMVKSVHALVFSQAKVLKRKSKTSKELLDTDVLIVNEDFKFNHYRVKINGMQMKETEHEKKATSAKVFTDRQHTVDACIVRTMKSRKTMKHADLIAAVFSQLKFPATSSDMKKRIEALIDRDYLVRDEEHQNIYHYVA